jgi:hypothetical protein
MPAKNPSSPNIQEFNEITAIILAELYKTHPHPATIDPAEVAKQLGVSPSDQMPSGKTFTDMFVHTLTWLANEGFVSRHGSIAPYRSNLTARTLAGLKNDLGSQLVDATRNGSSHDGKVALAEMVGSFFGSFTGSIAKALSGAG